MMKIFLSVWILLAGMTAMGASVSKQVEADWERQEQISWNREANSPAALDALLKRGALMVSDMKKQGVAEADKTAQILAEVSAAQQQLMDKKTPAGQAWLAQYLKARWALRELAFSNPLIDFDELLFVKRINELMNHQCGHRVGEAQKPGSNLCVLKGLSPDGEVREILSGEFTEGGIGRPDISFDGKRIVFPFARKRPESTSTGFAPVTLGGRGVCEKYDIYEVDLKGGAPRQVTDNLCSEDTEPCYMPGGRIAFTSSRDARLVQCGDWALVNGIFSVKSDGTDMYKITEPQDGEFYPSMLEDGRIMYTRWDYVMKPYNTQQQLWAVNPDGRRAELVYGDYYAFSKGPIALFEGRQIPGTSKVIATGAAHHNTCLGPIMIVDMNHNRGGPEGFSKVTPEVHYPEIEGEGEKGKNNRRESRTGWYGSPYPLGEKHFLVNYSFGPNTISNRGIYLMDIHGNKELIYRSSDKYSTYAPMPLRPRKEPRVIPNMVSGIDPDKPATLVVSDVYQGLLEEGVKRGEVKYLRIIEVLPKRQHTVPRRMDVGVNCGWDTRTVLGTVPVEEDGSIYFTLPPHKLIIFEALDKDYLEIKRMRNYINVKQGESVSCIGCHEPYGMAPPSMAKTPSALRRAPSPTTPPPWGVRGFSFAAVVQPVLDKHCVSCHNGSKKKGKAFDLRGEKMVEAPAYYDRDEGPQHAVSDSFLKLLDYVKYVKVGGHGNHDRSVLIPSPANSIGSRASKLMKILAKGHKGVKLTTDEWRAFAAWIDCNAPYYGDFSEIELHDFNAALQYSQSNKVPLSAQYSKKIAGLEEEARKIRRMRRVSLDNSSPATKIVSYLNCGAEKETKADPVKIKLLSGRAFTFSDCSQIEGADSAEGVVFFDTQEIKFKVSGLDANKKYRLGITWWDYDNGGRVQSIHGSRTDGKGRQQLRARAQLPNYTVDKKLAEQFYLTLPESLTKNKELNLYIKKEKGGNAVISEIWVEELTAPVAKIAPLNYSVAIADLRLSKGLIIENGKVVWEYPLKSATDIAVLANGNILLSGPSQILLLNRKKEVLFRQDGRELFTAHMTPSGTIKYNDNVARSIIEKQLDGTEVGRVSTAIQGSEIKTHYHALHYREAKDGSFWVAHRHNNKTRKYDKNGKVLRTIKLPCSATSVQELNNGNVLVSGGSPGPAKVIEFDAAGKKVWELSASDVPEANLITPCGIERLANGNTLVSNWTGHGFKGEYLPVFEVTPDKKIVRAITDLSLCPEPVAIQQL